MTTKKQWHPVFAELLRPLVESHYRIETNMSVGDAPRLADFVLLQRTHAGQLPVAGLWQNLTPWNVLEYKGPTVSPRNEDLELLVELGLGIHRRLNEEQAKQKQPLLGPETFSLWFLANRLGRRLMRDWRRRFPGLELQSPGVWRGQSFGRMVFLVSGVDLPVEEASLPLHLVNRESGAIETAVAQLLVGQPALWERYAGWLATLHPAVYEEVQNMAKQTKNPLRMDLTPIVKTMGMAWVVEQLGEEKVVDLLGAKKVIALLGNKQIYDQMGGALAAVEAAGGAEQFLAGLPPAQRQYFKQILEK